VRFVTISAIVTDVHVTCKNPTCPRDGKPFIARRASAEYCSTRCRTAAHRARNISPPPDTWFGDEPRLSATVKTVDADGSPALSRLELGERLIEIADRDDDGEPKTGRRLYYLALSHGFIRPD
jgi:hypothetical protein